MFFEQNEESFLQKEITLESSDDTMHKYFILRKKYKNDLDEKNLISFSLPGYPFFNQKIYTLCYQENLLKINHFLYM